MLDKIEINDKSIYIVRNHQYAALAWKEITSSLLAPPTLIIFDYHTDTHDAFLRYAYKKLVSNGIYQYDSDELNALIKKLCQDVITTGDYRNYIKLLKNDEHIDFAIKTNIISHAYVISHNTNPSKVMQSEEYKKWHDEKYMSFPPSDAQRPEDISYIMPHNKIIELDGEHLNALGIYNEKEVADAAITNFNVANYLEQIIKINRSIFGIQYDVFKNYILDVDLDYFRTLKSLAPDSCTEFYRLVRASKAITIALENNFVECCQLEGEQLTSEVILEKLLAHIDKATR